MAFAIIRFEKLKSMSAISAMSEHWSRSRPTPNADKTKVSANRVLVGSGCAADDVKALLDGLEPRKNAVLAMEGVLTASPEFFTTADKEAKVKWVKESVSWLKRTYGKNLVSAVLHLDETTPHIHAVVVPLDGRKKLNARAIFNREHMRFVQKDYPAALASLGLQRGIEHSKATHIEVKQWYAAIKSPVDSVKYKPLPEPPGILNRTNEGLAVWGNAVRQSVIDSIRPTFDAALARAKVADLAARREREQAQALRLSEREKQYHLDNISELLAQKDSLRAVDLKEVSEALGYSYNSDRQVWKNGDSTISITGHKFYDHEAMTGGGGAIDLVKHVTGHNFNDCLRWLADRFGLNRSVSTALEPERERLKNQVESTKTPDFMRPEPHPGNLQRVANYLHKTRGISMEIIRQAFSSGDLYADSKGNAVFLRRSMTGGQITGCMKRGTGEKRFVQVLGDRASGFFKFGDSRPDRIAVCESAIDALSFYELQRLSGAEKGLLVLSLDGCGEIPRDLQQLYPSARILAASDSDKAGEVLATKIKALYGRAERLKPHHKDWNDDLLSARSASADLAPTPSTPRPR